MTRRLLSSLTLALAACAGASPPREPAPAPEPAPRLTVTPYRFVADDGTAVDAELGTFEVPERRAAPGGRTIALSFVRFRSTAPRPGAPIVYLAGGPGGSGIAAARGPRFPIFLALREVADVIAFDQRGTGRSNHIPPCDGPGGATIDATRTGLIAYYRTGLTRCFDTWARAGVDLAGYTTRESADDLEALRRALAVPRLDLWGLSYGSHLGLAMLARHPTRVGRAVFAAVEGLEHTVKRPALTDALLAHVMTLIDRDPTAAALYPDLIGLMRRVHARLDAEPARATVTTPDGPVTVVFDSFPIRIIAGTLLKNPRDLGQLPLFYLALDHGVHQPAAALIAAAPAGFTGMPEAMDLASGISAGRLAQVEAEAATAVLGDALNFPMPHLRDLRPELDLGDDFRAMPIVATPVLLISGTLDGRTYVAEAEEVRRRLPAATHLLVEHGGHDLFEADPRIAAAVVDFFRGRPVPTALTLPPPVFATP